MDSFRGEADVEAKQSPAVSLVVCVVLLLGFLVALDTKALLASLVPVGATTTVTGNVLSVYEVTPARGRRNKATEAYVLAYELADGTHHVERYGEPGLYSVGAAAVVEVPANLERAQVERLRETKQPAYLLLLPVLLLAGAVASVVAMVRRG